MRLNVGDLVELLYDGTTFSGVITAVTPERVELAFTLNIFVEGPGKLTWPNGVDSHVDVGANALTKLHLRLPLEEVARAYASGGPVDLASVPPAKIRNPTRKTRTKELLAQADPSPDPAPAVAPEVAPAVAPAVAPGTAPQQAQRRPQALPTAHSFGPPPSAPAPAPPSPTAARPVPAPAQPPAPAAPAAQSDDFSLEDLIGEGAKADDLEALLSELGPDPGSDIAGLPDQESAVIPAEPFEPRPPRKRDGVWVEYEALVDGVNLADNDLFPANLLLVSSTGCLVRTMVTLAIGDRIQLRFTLGRDSFDLSSTVVYEETPEIYEVTYDTLPSEVRVRMLRAVLGLAKPELRTQESWTYKLRQKGNG